MKTPLDREQKHCLNAWYKFAAIFCVAAITVFAIFELEKNHIQFHFKGSSDESAEYILIAASGPTLKSPVAVQLETCSDFLLVDESTNHFTSFKNTPESFNLTALKDFMDRQNIEAVITGTMEIGTFQLLTASNIEVYSGVTGTAGDAVKKHRKHELVTFSKYYMGSNNLKKSSNPAGNMQNTTRTRY